MKNTIRTTISLPEDLYFHLKHAAIDQRKTISNIIVEKISPKPDVEIGNKSKRKVAFLDLAGSLHKYYLKNPIDINSFRDEVDWSDV